MYSLAFYKKEFATNWKLAFPVILGMLGHTFVAFADNIMVGQLGAAELAAVSLGNSFFFVAFAVGIGISAAITPLIAEADGLRKKLNVKKVFKHGSVICLSSGIILFGVLLVLGPLMESMKQPPEVVALAIPYYEIISLSLIPIMVFQAFRTLCDGLSRTKIPMYATLISNALNILFNYLLIFGNWGFPKLGVIGAGYGTLISRILMVIFIAVVLYRSAYFREFITRLNWKKTSWGYVKKILNLGLPTSAQVFFEVTLFTMAVWLSGILGTVEQAANQIALNLSSMTYMVGQGLGVAAMIRVGNQKGKKDIARLREVAFSLFAMTLLIEIVFALAFLIFRFDLPLVYLDTESSLNQVENLKVISLASMLLLWSAFFQISDGLQVVILGALRGIQDVNVPALIAFIAYWVIAFPICYVLAIELEWGGNGIWIGLLVGLTASALMLYLRFVFLLRKQQF